MGTRHLEGISHSQPSLSIAVVQGPHDGVIEWIATNETFPRGLASFQDKVKRPIIAHNRFWSDKAVYARQNGGEYVLPSAGFRCLLFRES